jgi:competence protein ComEC
MNLFYARPVIPFLIALISGIFLGSEYPGYQLWAFAGAAICAGYIVFCVLGHRNVLMAPCVFFLLVGYISLQPWVSPDFPPHHIIHYTDSKRWKIVGVVDSRPFAVNARQKFILRAQQLAYADEVMPATGGLRVTVAGGGLELRAGDRVSLNSRIRSIRNFNNPGGFDYQSYMAFKGVWGSAFVNVDRLRILERAPCSLLSGKIDNARSHIAKMIEKNSTGSRIGVLKALLIGERSAVSAEVRENFNRAGVGHLLAISGLHVGIVATVAFVLFQRLLSNFSVLLWRAWTRKGAAVLALLPVCLYGLISGLSPSTQRAMIMISTFLMTFVFEREQDLINTLALAALVILAVYPPSLFSVSFQLSFSAVLSIVYGIQRMQRGRRDRENADPASLSARIRKRLVTFFFVSLFAIAGTLPLTMFYFNQISVIGIFANFFVVPLVGFIAVPVGLVGVFASPFCMTCAAWCFTACDLVLRLALFLIEIFADIPFAALKTFSPTLVEIGCYYVLAGSLWYWLTTEPPADGRRKGRHQAFFADHGKDRAKKKSGRPKRLFLYIRDAVGTGVRQLLRQKASGKSHPVAAALVFVVLLVMAVDGGYWVYSRFFNNDLKVTFIDVGQGNAALLELPRGHTMLIDGGGFSDNSIFDMGARVVAPLLRRRKISTIDTLILSHPNSDHMNGLIYIAENFKVRQVWTNNESRNTVGYRTFIKIIAQKGIRMPKFENLVREQVINGVNLSILYPQKDFLKKIATDKWRNSNNNSLVARISLGSISLLFPGDISAEAEGELVRTSARDLSSTVLLAPHHGSRTSSTQSFLDCVDPQIVVISAGWKNRFYFPHPDVLKRYQKQDCRIFRLDQHGAVTLVTDGQNLAVKPFLKNPELN